MNRMTVKLATTVLIVMVLCAAGSAEAFIRDKIALKQGHDAYARQDYPGALAGYHKAAGFGNAEAQFYLSAMYLEGKGTAKDEATAVMWMQKAADSGYAPAQFSMGLNYLRGTGVSKDPGKACALFQKGAQSEDADAQYFLAFLSAIGHGTVKDEGQALRWFRLAKSNGFPVPDDLLTPAGVVKLGKNKWIGSKTSQRSGMSAGRELVRRIQAGLARLGYQIGSADGIFGKKTETAIKAYQMKKGLAADGKATQALLKKIEAEK